MPDRLCGARVALRYHDYPMLAIDGAVQPLKLKRGLALLVLLRELERKLARARAAELLWPDAAVDVGRARLRRLAHEVNSVIGIDLVVGDGDALWLSEGVAVDADVVATRRIAQRWVSATAGAPAPPPSADALLEPGAEGLMQGFRLDASDAFDDWLDARRSEQLRLVLRALERAGEHALAQGNAALAARAAERLIALDALADAGHALLLRARARAGDAAGVEAAYFACAEVLRRELGVRPSPRIEAAYAQAKPALASASAPADAPRSGGAGASDALPPIRFADTSDGAVAFLELGAGPTTLIVLFGLWSHVEVAWDEPRIRAILERLARRCRVVLVDRRGIGLSERLAVPHSLGSAVEDLEAVRRALDVDRVWLFGNSAGGMAAIEYATACAAHVEGLVLYATGARGSWARDYPWALTPEQLDKWLAELQGAWGGATSLANFAPSAAADPAAAAWWARLLRQSASKNSFAQMLRAFGRMDVCERLPLVRVPTLVVHRAGDRIVREGAARYVASRIPGAKRVTLPGDDHALWVGDSDAVIDAVEAFIERQPRSG